MDSVLHKLEKYADNLENIVQQRTALLIDEKHKTDTLLYRMLPPYDFLAMLYYESSVNRTVYRKAQRLVDIVAN